MINSRVLLDKKNTHSAMTIAMALLLTLISGCNHSVESNQPDPNTSENTAHVEAPSATDANNLDKQEEKSADVSLWR